MQDCVFELVDFVHQDMLSSYRKEMLEANSNMDGCARLRAFEDMKKYILDCRLFEDIKTCPPNHSLGFEYLYIDKKNDEIIGMLNFRPNALDYATTRLYAGHIGYSIRPSKRKLGYGTKMLHDFLPICKNKGLHEVLITCLQDNVASAKIIEANNGVYEKNVYYQAHQAELRRYWIKL